MRGKDKEATFEVKWLNFSELMEDIIFRLKAFPKCQTGQAKIKLLQQRNTPSIFPLRATVQNKIRKSH